MEDLVTKVSEHERTLDKLTNAVEHLAESSKGTNERLKDIASSMSKQEVILEKIANMDERYKDSISRLHKRIDETEREHSRDLELFIKPLKDDVEQLKSDRSWIVKIIIGAVVTAVMGLVLYTKGS